MASILQLYFIIFKFQAKLTNIGLNPGQKLHITRILENDLVLSKNPENERKPLTFASRIKWFELAEKLNSLGARKSVQEWKECVLNLELKVTNA